MPRGGNGNGGGGDTGGGTISISGRKGYGTDGNDIIIGSAKDNEIWALDGNDDINSGAGHDAIYAGSGDDFVQGGDGNDWITGDDGYDTIFGDVGNDTLWGGRGTDALYGGDGDDYLFGDERPSVDANYDTVGEGDILDGGGGNDVLYGYMGADYLTGGDGADRFMFRPHHTTEAQTDLVTDFDPSEGDLLWYADFGGVDVDLSYELLDGDSETPGYQTFATTEDRDAALAGGSGGVATFTLGDFNNDGVDDVRLDIFAFGNTTASPNSTLFLLDYVPEPAHATWGLTGDLDIFYIG